MTKLISEKANSVIAYISTIKDLKVEGKNKKYLYRGQENESWELIPTIQRRMRQKEGQQVLDDVIKDRHKLEKKMLNDFKRFARPYLEHLPKNEWEWIALAQHHKLPTRFLDWTEHAATALFFAVDNCSNHNVDGVVWCFEMPDTLDKYVDPESKIKPFECREIKIYRPPHIIKNITLQKGCFSVHPTDYLHENYHWPSAELIKIIIPGDNKKSILHDLIQLGVSKASIYGNLESIASEIKRENLFDCMYDCFYRESLFEGYQG